MSTPTDDDDDTIGIMDIKVALEKVFKGCKVSLPSSLAGFHAELSFYEYEIRVILTGERAKGRKMHYRFQQKVQQPGERKPTKRVIIEREMTEPAELLKAIDDTKAHLMGIVYAVTRALKEPTANRMHGIDDLFR